MMSVIVPLDRLRAEIANFTSEPYLLTVTAGNRPHCGTVTVDWDLARRCLLMRPPSSWPGSEASGYQEVSVLWPPAEPGGYSLIVDGAAGIVHDDGVTRLAVTPSRAVLHRRGSAAADSGSSCRSDCVPLLG